MNSLTNICKHPRTSLAGLLIAALAISGVLSQQGITLGHAGSGSVVSLVAALATAILGLLARDPSGMDLATAPQTASPPQPGPQP